MLRPSNGLVRVNKVPCLCLWGRLCSASFQWYVLKIHIMPPIFIQLLICHQSCYQVVYQLFQLNYFHSIFRWAPHKICLRKSATRVIFFFKFCRWKLSTIEDDRWSSGERVSWCIYNPAELTSSLYYCCPYTRLLLTERTSNKIRCDDIIAAETSKTRWAWGQRYLDQCKRDGGLSYYSNLFYS